MEEQTTQNNPSGENHQPNQTEQPNQADQNKAEPKEEPAAEQEKKAPVDQAEKSDVEKNKVAAILAYFLFFLPLLMAKESKFAKYHANQGLLLLLLAIAVYVVGMVIPIIGWIIILPLGQLFVFVLFVMGIINASKGEMKELPVIGHIKLLS